VSKFLLAVTLFAAPFAIAQTLSLKVAGVSRTTTLHVPTSGLSKPALVFVLHGLGGDGPGMQSGTQMDKVADREKFVVAYPNAVGGTWDYAGAKNDYAFLKAILDTTVARYQVDRNRVYISGFSQGGGEAVYAAFNYPDVYAAVAPVSSVGSGAPTPKRPIPILLTFGTKDLYTPATFMASVAGWIKIDSCAATPTVVRPYPATNSKSVVTRLTYGKCAQGTEIVVDSIQGGGHEWPNNTATKINNAEEVWAFFKKFTLDRGTTGVRRTDLVSGRPLSATYRAGVVRLEGVDENCQVRVVDARGRVVVFARATDGRFAWTAPSRGLYAIEVGEGRETRSVRVAVP
jgi:poly(3-hydroxybutyrate) depolymerase